MTRLKNKRMIRALKREAVDKTPIWIMRQAGRYLPEYRKVRAKAGSFMALCQNPELACEVTMQPLRRFDLDAAILFSDILTIPDAMGLGLSFVEGEGPIFAKPIMSASELGRLGVPDPEDDLRYVMDAVRTIKRELDGALPLIGFSGSPWTLATYMLEGRANKNFTKAKWWLQHEPRALHQLLGVLAKAVAEYLKAQVAAGVDVIMIFDTWGGVLSVDDYRNYSLYYMQQILSELDANIPSILFSKGCAHSLEQMADTGCSALGLDWTINLAEARKRVGDRVALQGNLNPAMLRQSSEKMQAAARAIIQDYGKGPGHIFNLGHGITPDIDPGRVKILVDTVHEQGI